MGRWPNTSRSSSVFSFSPAAESFFASFSACLAQTTAHFTKQPPLHSCPEAHRVPPTGLWWPAVGAPIEGGVRPHPRSLEVCKHALLTGGAWLVRLLAAWGGVPTRRHSSDRRHLVSCLHTPSRMCIRMCIFLLQCSHWGGHGCSTRNSVGASA